MINKKRALESVADILISNSFAKNKAKSQKAIDGNILLDIQLITDLFTQCINHKGTIYFDNIYEILTTTSKRKLRKFYKKEVNSSNAEIAAIKLGYITALRIYFAGMIKDKTNVAQYLQNKGSYKFSRYFLNRFNKMTYKTIPSYLSTKISESDIEQVFFKFSNMLMPFSKNQTEFKINRRKVFFCFISELLNRNKINEKVLSTGCKISMCGQPYNDLIQLDEPNIQNHPAIHKYLRNILKKGIVYYPTLSNISFTKDHKILDAGAQDGQALIENIDKISDTLFGYLLKEEQGKLETKRCVSGENFDRSYAINPLFGSVRSFIEKAESGSKDAIKEARKDLFIALRSLQKDLKNKKNGKEFFEELHFYLNFPINIAGNKNAPDNNIRSKTTFADFLLFLSETNLRYTEKRLVNSLIGRLHITKGEIVENDKPAIYTMEQIKTKYHEQMLENSNYCNDFNLYEQESLRQLLNKKARGRITDKCKVNSAQTNNKSKEIPMIPIVSEMLNETRVEEKQGSQSDQVTEIYLTLSGSTILKEISKQDEEDRPSSDTIIEDVIEDKNYSDSLNDANEDKITQVIPQTLFVSRLTSKLIGKNAMQQNEGAII